MKWLRDGNRDTCPQCGELVLVNKDGRLRVHRRWQAGGMYSPPKWVKCEGSGTL